MLDILNEEVQYRNFDITQVKRTETFVNNTMKKYGGRFNVPEMVTTTLENVFNPDTMKNPDEFKRRNRDVVETIRYDFVSQILDLLEDESIWGNLDNLVVNPDNPFGKYVNTSGLLDEVFDGCWYDESYAREVKNPDFEFYMPIIGYMDKTGTDKYQRNGLEPFIFTTAVIKQSLRFKTDAWRCLGYVPDLDLKSSAQKKAQRSRKKNRGSSLRNYHKCLKSIIQQIHDADQNGIYVYLRLGGQIKCVRIRTPIAYIIGDAKSGDVLCLRYMAHWNAARLCRACNVSFKEADNPDHVCRFIQKEDIELLLQKALQDEPDEPDIPDYISSREKTDNERIPSA